ncbi:MAG TPA: hypothetical protein VG942_18020 [Hyphomonadaceae bacterium]|nr:hypothetical protein [Hyphomonadaceae bacterium]
MTDKRVLLVGIDPDKMDFSAPGTPPGVTAQLVHTAIAMGNARMDQQAIAHDMLLIAPNEPNDDALIHQLKQSNYEVVVIGGGLRKPDATVALLERTLNAIHEHAPSAKIAFNTNPTDSADAALRWLRP